MRIFGHDRHRHENPWAEAPAWAIELGAIGLIIIENQETTMATLDQVLQDVTDEASRLDALSVLISGLKQQVSDALTGVTLPPAVQTKIDAIFTAAEANKGKIDTALNGTPPSATPAAPTT